jgi:pimeloyl-ACP methyl ester carboxylesterase
MPFSDGLAQVIKENNLRVLEVLRPGYGKSGMLKYKSVGEYAKALNGLVAKLELARFDTLGVSAGAPYAYALAALYPEMVGRVHICGGIPLDCYKDIYGMNSAPERFMFSLSRVLPAGFIGKYAVSAMEAMEKKAGWKPHICGESMDQMFDNYVRPNWQGIGWSTHVQYKGWGFDPGKITCPVQIYYS